MAKNRNRQIQRQDGVIETSAGAEAVDAMQDETVGDDASENVESSTESTESVTTEATADDGGEAAGEEVVGSVIQPIQSETPPAPVAPTQGSVATLQANDADTAQLAMYRHRLDEHIARMGRAVPVSPKDGAAHQLHLYRLIIEILRQDGTVFTRAWSDLLAKVHSEANGAFHESRAFRFFDQLKLEPAETRVFQNLLHLIIHTADPKGRFVMLKNIDLGSVVANVPVPNAADKITGFYTP